MTWSLGLSVGPGGVGAALGVDGGEARLIGVYQDIGAAVRATQGEQGSAPERVVLVHPSGVTVRDLRSEVGDLASAGVPDDDAQLRTDVEVLSAVTGHRVLLIDADRDLISGHPGKTEPFAADRLAALVAEHPHETAVALTGHPETRDRYHAVARDYAPMIVERPALAALALQVPATSALVTTPRTAGALRGRPALPLVLTAIPVVAVLLLLLLL